MANQWFRMYAEFANDPKVQMLSETDQRRYIMALCIRCNGDVTLQNEEVSFQLRISNDEWLVTKAVLVAKNLITDDNKPTAWDKRQFLSDVSAPRVARHRAKKKAECNVTETPQIQNRTDTDTEPVKEKKRAPRFDFLQSLLNEGVPEQAAKDYIATRKAKRCAQTETAFSQFLIEVGKAGVTPADAVAVCCKKSWGGFEAEWLAKERPNARASPVATTGRQSRVDNYAAEAAAARGGYENEHSTSRTERDITSESIRVA